MAYPDFFLVGAPTAGTTALAGQWLPPRAWRIGARPVLRALQDQGVARPRLTMEQRAALLLHFEADIRLLGQVTGTDYNDWLRPDGRGAFADRENAGLTPTTATGLTGASPAGGATSKQVATTERIVTHLQQHEDVAWVAHPSAAGSPSAALAAATCPAAPGRCCRSDSRATRHAPRPSSPRRNCSAPRPTSATGARSSSTPRTPRTASWTRPSRQRRASAPGPAVVRRSGG